MLLMRGTQWDKNLSPEQLQTELAKFMGWFERLKSEGKCRAGQPLHMTGKVVAKSGVSDGPFAESKEAVGGYFILTVNTLDEAVAIAQQCPAVKHGIICEVRPVAERCSLMEH